MPKCFERKATESGRIRARSHNRCGAVLRRRRSRSTVMDAVIRRSLVARFLWLNSIAQSNYESIACQALAAPGAASHRGLFHAVDDEPRKFPCDMRDRRVFLAIPARCCIAHAEYGERRHARVEIGTEFAFRDTFPDHILENALQPARPAADALAALGRQMLAFVLDYLDEIAPIDEWRQMRIDQ